MSIKVKFQNNMDFSSLQSQVRQELEEAMRQTGDAIVQDMKDNVPVRTGRLRDSIHAETTVNGDTITTTIVADAESDGFHADGVDIDPVHYAQFVEYGTGRGNSTWYFPVVETDAHGREHVRWVETRGQAAEPFLEPAVDENIKEFSEQLRTAITEAFKQTR